MIRVTFRVANGTKAAVEVLTEKFSLDGRRSFDDGLQTFPLLKTLQPGEEVSGTVGWIVDSGKAPSSARICYPIQLPEFGQPCNSEREYQFNKVVEVVAVPLPLPEDVAPEEGTTASVGFEVIGPARSWIGTDGSRIVAAEVSITNTLPMPIRFSRRYLQSLVRHPSDRQARYGNLSEADTSLDEMVNLAPDQSARGTVAWWWMGDSGLPRRGHVELGGQNHPLAREAIDIRDRGDTR